jgi:hypothetical protein
MFNYPVEKYILRFYKYKFLGYEETPIEVEAYNKLEARRRLTAFLQQNPQYSTLPVVSESLSLPIFGETIKIIGDVENVWVGEPTRWMPLQQFEKLGYE